LSAGLTPGPLLTLVLAQTLRHGPGEGCRIALAPLLTDLPIILLALALATKLHEFHKLLGLLCFAGGAFIFHLALESLRAQPPAAEAPDTPPRSWRKGVLTNLLNPSPWLFWVTVGSATLSKNLAESAAAAAVFLACFYVAMVGSKLVLAMAAGRSRHLLDGPAYRWTLRLLGGLLALFALSLVRDGLRYFGLVPLAV
jgi:threonine/homoserine/homoserine lactone efflux protein